MSRSKVKVEGIFGSVPVRRFVPRFRFLMFTRWERPEGIEPPREFDVNFNIVSKVREVKELGRVPLIDSNPKSILVIPLELQDTPVKLQLVLVVKVLHTQLVTFAILVDAIISQMKFFSMVA